MCLYHCFYITQPQPKTFYIMEVTGMGTVKFFENPAQRFFVHTDAIIFYFYLTNW